MSRSERVGNRRSNKGSGGGIGVREREKRRNRRCRSQRLQASRTVVYLIVFVSILVAATTTTNDSSNDLCPRRQGPIRALVSLDAPNGTGPITARSSFHMRVRRKGRCPSSAASAAACFARASSVTSVGDNQQSASDSKAGRVAQDADEVPDENPIKGYAPVGLAVRAVASSCPARVSTHDPFHSSGRASAHCFAVGIRKPGVRGRGVLSPSPSGARNSPRLRDSDDSTSPMTDTVWPRPPTPTRPGRVGSAELRWNRPNSVTVAARPSLGSPIFFLCIRRAGRSRRRMPTSLSERESW